MALAVDALQLGPIGTNCYLVRAGPQARPRRSSSIPARTRPRSGSRSPAAARRCAAILLTHSHYDHFGALADLAEGTGAPVWLPEGELDVFRRPSDFFPGRPDPPLRGRGDAARRRRDDRGCRHRVPGAVRPRPFAGHLAYYADGYLFSGDVLFAGSVGRTDLPVRRLGHAARLDPHGSSRRYPPETVVYSGHGPATTLGAELARNPFLAELRAPD